MKTDSKPISNRYSLSVGDHYLNSCGSDPSTKEVEAGGWQVSGQLGSVVRPDLINQSININKKL